MKSIDAATLFSERSKSPYDYATEELADALKRFEDHFGAGTSHLLMDVLYAAENVSTELRYAFEDAQDRAKAS